MTPDRLPLSVATPLGAVLAAAPPGGVTAVWLAGAPPTPLLVRSGAVVLAVGGDLARLCERAPIVLVRGAAGPLPVLASSLRVA